MRRIVIVGAGLAGLNAARTLRREGFNGELIVVGDEPSPPYDRPPLSKQVLAGTMDTTDCVFDDHAVIDASWQLGRAVTALRTADQVVELDSGGELAYDGLVIATGRRARELTMPDLEGVVTLRRLDDASRLQAAARNARNVVIVGAGFIGCEVAATLRGSCGARVTVIDVAEAPMPAIGAEAGARARGLHEQHGVDFRLRAGVASIDGGERVEAVTLDDGSRLRADIVLVAVGAVPNTEWLESSALTLHNGSVVCDEQCFAAGADNIVAVGDVAAWPHPQAGGLTAVEHWTNARDMARAGACNLLVGREAAARYEPIPSFWSDQYDVKIKSLGFLRQATSFAVVEEDTDRRRLVVEALRGEQLVGVILFNRNRALVDYQQRLELAASPA
jgi:NADPH-dependent 2,4-dienoyl-CoA reductase/sulfur reductase-like enzyme